MKGELFPPLIPQKVLVRAAKLNPALLSDGMSALGIPGEGCMDAGILPVDMGMTMLGTAVTVETEEGDNFPIHMLAYKRHEGYVMVVDGKGYDKRAYCGNMIINAVAEMGYRGMVIDGMIRDRKECVELGFPVFSRGYIQRGPVKKRQGIINQEILCGGVRVKPGDLVMGGADGVTVVPRERIGEVLKMAEEKQAYERDRVAALEEYRLAAEKGGPLPDITPAWVRELREQQKE